MGYLDNTGLAYLWQKIKAYIDAHSGNPQVVKLYETAEWTILKYGHVVMVQAHGASCATAAVGVCPYTMPEEYRPSYNVSNLIATASGSAQFCRLYVTASNGQISTAQTGTSGTYTWYGTLTYVYE